MITADLSIEDYLASRRVSAHKLRTLADKGARAYYIAHEQKRWSEDDTRAYLAGRATEDALQRPDDFAANYIAKPEGMSFGSKEGAVWRAFVQGTDIECCLDPGHLPLARAVEAAWRGDFAAHFAVKPEGMSFAHKDGKAWKAEQGQRTIITADDMSSVERLLKLLPERPAAPRSVLEGDDARAIAALVETLGSCPLARALIDEAAKQVSILHDNVMGLPGVQSRPDWLCLNGCAASEWQPYALDLKTTLTLGQLASGRSILKYGYHRQAAMVRTSLALEGVDVSGLRYLLLGAEKTFPFRWRVIEVPKELIDVGERWCERHMLRLADHYATGEWPLVDSEITVADVPAWFDDSEAA